MATKTLYMETTKVEASQTVGEILSLLVRHGATKSQIEYVDGDVAAVSFCVEAGCREVYFREDSNV
jgi:hypothetical protein